MSNRNTPKYWRFLNPDEQPRLGDEQMANIKGEIITRRPIESFVDSTIEVTCQRCGKVLEDKYEMVFQLCKEHEAAMRKQWADFDSAKST